MQVNAGTWRLLLAAPCTLAVKLVASRAVWPTCVSQVRHVQHLHFAGQGREARWRQVRSREVHKASLERQRAMPAPPAICCCIQDARSREGGAPCGQRLGQHHAQQTTQEGPRQGIQLPPNQVALSELFVVYDVAAVVCKELHSLKFGRLVHSRKLQVGWAQLGAAQGWLGAHVRCALAPTATC